MGTSPLFNIDSTTPRYKIHNSILDLEGRPRRQHRLSSYIEISKDKGGMGRAVLRMPRR